MHPCSVCAWETTHATSKTQVQLAVYAVLCPTLCMCGTESHDVCETMDGSVTVYAVFINSIINSFALGGQHKVIPTNEVC